MHHIIMDGSASLDKGVFEAISAYYNEEGYVAKLSNMEQVKLATDLEITLSTNLEQHKDKYKKFWHEQLLEVNDIDINFLRLSDDYSSQNTIESNNSIAEINFSFGEAELAKLNHVKSIYGVTPYGYGQCIFALLLHRYTGHERLAVSYPIAIKEGLDFVYGAQINTNLIPYQFSQTTTIIDLFNQNKGFFKLTMKDEPKHGYYPITDIIQINRNKQLLNICFAQTFFREHPFKFNGITKVETHTELSVDGVAPDMLLFEHDARNNKLNYRVRYDAKFTNKELLNNFVESYKKLFSEILEEITKRKSSSRVSDYNILTAEQYRKIVCEFNKTEVDYPHDKTVHKLFEEQAHSTPDNIAIVHENGKLTYCELNKKANRLARYLHNIYKVKSDDLIVLCFNKSEQMIEAMLGVLKAGAAYVSLNPNYPDERISYILRDTECEVILTNDLYKNRIQKIIQKTGISIISLDNKKFQNNLAKEENIDLTTTTTSKNLIYIIYTSGTTGNPKGVMVEHKGVVSLVKNINYVKISSNDSFIQLSDLGFDASTFEIWMPLLNGAKLIIPGEKIDLFDNVKLFHNTLIKNKITILWLTKSLFDYLFLTNESIFENIKYLLVGGEALNKWLITKLIDSSYSPQNVINGYGPTENTTFSCTLNITKAVLNNIDSVPIGTPLTNRKAYVLDLNRNILPIGVIGELYVGGEGLARGYLNKPDLTSEKFIDNPFQTTEEKRINKNAKLYKTGDLVRMLFDGNLEFIGRSDFQVKVRGYRIELEEIESKLLAYPGVKQSVAIVIDSFNSSDKSIIENKHIVLYYVANNKIDNTTITEYLAKQLPSYMLPNAIIYLEKLPLTINGKINRDALPKPKFTDKTNYVAPKTEVEVKLCEIYSEILDLPMDNIGIKDTFYDLGGNSLTAIRLASVINQQIKSNILAREILNDGTIKDIAKLISDKTRKFIYQNYVIQNANTDALYQPFELTNIQQAYYFGRFENFTLGNTSAHLYTEYEFKFLDVSKLENALNKLIERHYNLRMILEDGKQRYLEQYPYYHVKFCKLNDVYELENIRGEYSHKVYAVDRLWLFDIFVSKLEDRYILHFSLDALIMDAHSIWVFLNELSILYEDSLYELPRLNISYRDYIEQSTIIRQSNLFNEAKKYWLSRIDDYNFELALPLQKQPNAINQPKFARISKVLDAKTWEKITAKVNHYGIGQTVVMLYIYGYVLSYWSNQDKLCINLTLFNRLPLHKQINDLIGDFTVLELFSYVNDKNSNKHSLSALFKNSYNRLWDDIEHNLFDGLDFQRLVRGKYSHDKIMAPAVLTSILGTDYGNIKILDKTCTGINYSITQTPQVWLDNKAYEQDGKLIVEWDYVEELFAIQTIKAMHEHYFNLIEYLAKADWEKDGLPLLSLPGKDQEIIERANITTQSYSKHTLVSKYEEFIVNKKLTQKIAVVDIENNGKKYKYKVLLENSDLLARHIYAVINNLCNTNNKSSITIALNDTKLIAVLSGKGYNQVISVLSIMKAGFGYLPLCVDWPLSRIEEILDQAGVQVVLISKQEYIRYELKHRLTTKYLLIVIEEALEAIAYDYLQRTNLLQITLPKVTTDDVAYVVFTSGSTGNPKGVTISHRGALNTIDAINSKFLVTEKDIVLAISELSFDLSVYDMFGLLAVGGTIVFLPQYKTKEPRYWLEIIKNHKITIWNTVPQLAELLIDEMDASNCIDISSIRLFLLSGDWVPVILPERIKKHCYKAKTVSLGGATESSIWSIWHEIDKVEPMWNSIPYGVAMPNQKMYVLNKDFQHCPVYVVGEIYIGEIGVALNYWKDQSRTEVSFIEHPQLGRLYKTGDLGRWNINGYMEFMGRRDKQIKMRGYRIELEEIEKKLTTYPGIIQAVVVVKEHITRGRYLVAYYVSLDKLDNEAIQNSLRNMLPDYMIPNTLIHLTRIFHQKSGGNLNNPIRFMMI